MNNVPLIDRETIVNRVALGLSYSHAMENTAIKSKSTVSKIVSQEKNAIERKRQQYLKKIKKFGGSDENRARMWGKMIYANKVVGKHAVVAPDWQARSIALKYIDSLGDLDKAEEMKVEVTDKTPSQIVDPNSQEAKDFNKMFRQFVKTSN